MRRDGRITSLTLPLCCHNDKDETVTRYESPEPVTVISDGSTDTLPTSKFNGPMSATGSLNVTDQTKVLAEVSYSKGDERAIDTIVGGRLSY